ncbi:MAG TPA: GntR family transcriptional regulator [Tissierellaceae bacterium]|nr:GntR family transcriptional regulator [Tissierellaceae bacterium]
MKFNDNLPIYMQIMNYIKNKIIAEEFSDGDKLPSVRELSEKLKVNPNTIQRSYQELERNELVFTKRGMGRFVTGDKERLEKIKVDKASNLINEFIKDMYSLGFKNKDIINLINEEIRSGNDE